MAVSKDFKKCAGFVARLKGELDKSTPNKEKVKEAISEIKDVAGSAAHLYVAMLKKKDLQKLHALLRS